MVFFAVKKLLSFIRFHMFIFAFISIALGDWPEKALLQSISDIVLPVSSFRSFLVSCLLFKFKPFWVCVCECYNFIALYAAVHMSQHHFLKRLFSSLYTFASFVKD